MSCCRGRTRHNISAATQSPDCKTLEDTGARTILRVVSTAQGARLVVATKQNGFVDLGSFLASFRCGGSTARLLSRYVPIIQNALTLDPATFLRYRSGITITDAIRVADAVTKRSQQHVEESRQPHASN